MREKKGFQRYIWNYNTYSVISEINFQGVILDILGCNCSSHSIYDFNIPFSQDLFSFPLLSTLFHQKLKYIGKMKQMVEQLILSHEKFKEKLHFPFSLFRVFHENCTLTLTLRKILEKQE